MFPSSSFAVLDAPSAAFAATREFENKQPRVEEAAIRKYTLTRRLICFLFVFSEVQGFYPPGVLVIRFAVYINPIQLLLLRYSVCGEAVFLFCMHCDNLFEKMWKFSNIGVIKMDINNKNHRP